MDPEVIELLKIIFTGVASALAAVATYVTYQTRKAKNADDLENSLIVDLRTQLTTLRADFDAYKASAEKERQALQKQVDKLIDQNAEKDRKIDRLESDLQAARETMAEQRGRNSQLNETFERIVMAMPWQVPAAEPRTIS